MLYLTGNWPIREEYNGRSVMFTQCARNSLNSQNCSSVNVCTLAFRLPCTSGDDKTREMHQHEKAHVTLLTYSCLVVELGTVTTCTTQGNRCRSLLGVLDYSLQRCVVSWKNARNVFECQASCSMIYDMIFANFITILSNPYGSSSLVCHLSKILT